MIQKRSFQVIEFESPGIRDHQEDHVTTNAERGFFIVADGFGGPIAGKEAARVACESVKEFLEKEAGDLDATMPFVLRSYYSLAGNVLFNAILYANRKLLELNKSKNVHEKGGTSILAGFLDGDLLALANVGCCSGHLFRDRQSREVIAPRSLSRLVHPVAIDPIDHADAPLTALGIYRDLEPEITEIKLMHGDWVLLQTDGVRESFRERIIGVHGGGYERTHSENQVKQLSESFSYPENASFALVLF